MFFRRTARFFMKTLLWASVAAFTYVLAADSTPGLSIATQAERRVQINGAIEYVPADQLHVGDEIFYTLRVRNSDNTARETIIVKPIPRNTRYVPNSATGPGVVVDFSVDGGVTFAPAEQLLAHAAGNVTRPATVDDYTHIRWRLRHPLASGATALLRFRAVLR
jgi:uncharacterized repeat protein (TIGR01451 family)